MMTEQKNLSPDEDSLCLWCPTITTALLCARQQQVPICLSSPERPRELGPAECRLLHMDRESATLLCRAAALPQKLAGQECSLYFKVREPESGQEMQTLEGSDIRLPLSAGDLRLTTQERLTGRRYGFYSKSTVLSVMPAGETASLWPEAGGELLAVRIKTPFRCVQRELRRHPRYFLQPSQCHMACFWFAPVLPEEGEVMLGAIARYTPEMKARTEIVDISAGGAFVRLNNDPLLKDVHIDASTLMLLYLSLDDAQEGSVNVFAAARCVAVSRNRREMSANIHMRFTKQAVLPLREGPIRWLNLDDDAGIAALDRWIARQRATDLARGVFRS
ncbi:MAG TPA: hypothetical protein H9784_05350 [Candidatus Desulfovibrio intestinavium]|uniref:PilZ domain-containing protein n=1 Tax=Candidatus Desulfovibrio intestinavium TaxID=2838534 RepID=A0A9D2HNE1_9BACT|nr:hypothetical protein [Candidatus Desulfovibrio intestinavium]